MMREGMRRRDETVSIPLLAGYRGAGRGGDGGCDGGCDGGGDGGWGGRDLGGRS